MTEVTKHPLKWLAVFGGGYAELRYKGNVNEKAAVFDELIDIMLIEKVPACDVNKLNLARSHVLWSDYLAKKKKKEKDTAEARKQHWKKIKEDNAAIRDEYGGDVFESEKYERPERGEVIEYGRKLGLELAEQWLDWTIAHDWKDTAGKSIRYWKLACKTYEKEHNPNFNPKDKKK
jgi:hypothetical protein